MKPIPVTIPDELLDLTPGPVRDLALDRWRRALAVKHATAADLAEIGNIILSVALATHEEARIRGEIQIAQKALDECVTLGKGLSELLDGTILKGQN